MVKIYGVLLPLLLLLVVTNASLTRAEETDGDQTDFLNEWVVEIDGDLDHVKRVVERRGFELIRDMPNIENHYILRLVDEPKRSKRSAEHHTVRLAEDKDVKWAEQQFARKRTKRGYMEELQKIMKKMRTTKQNRTCPALNNTMFNDPLFPCQWYLAGDETGRKYMTNCQEVWKQNITGNGVVVSVVDDGLEINNTDLAPNYDGNASFDFNDDDPNPMARYDPTDENRHGTRCAGEIAMVANNSDCGVGIAYNCKLGGIRLLDGNVTDRSEAESLGFNCSYISIYSLSWGPTDDGKTMDMPRKLAQRAMDMGIKEGRGGKGVIYVLASGNGGGAMDNCNCDGYASSMYTISVSSASWDGTKPWFGECCASTLTTTYSSGHYSGMSRISVVSTDLHDGCTLSHSGTSASAPIASAIIALVLEVNPNLTWIDVQHLVAASSKLDQLDKKDWYKNAAGFCVSPSFGFGLMDCADIVRRAKTWINVPERRSCSIEPVISPKREERLPREVENGTKAELTFDVNLGCCQNESTVIRSLEHVQFVFSMNYSSRGAVSAYAISPNGTETCLLGPRRLDNSTDNYRDWPVMSVHTWGENPCGIWRFRIEDENIQGANQGTLLKVTMTVHGTAEVPAYRSDPTVYCNLTKPDEKTTTASETSSNTGASNTNASDTSASNTSASKTSASNSNAKDTGSSETSNNPPETSIDADASETSGETISDAAGSEMGHALWL